MGEGEGEGVLERLRSFIICGVRWRFSRRKNIMRAASAEKKKSFCSCGSHPS